MPARQGISLLLGIMLGCAGAPRKAEENPETRDTASLMVQVLPAGAQEGQPVAPGKTLHSGDRYTLIVESGQPGYVYALLAPQARPPQVLFPGSSDGDQRIESGVPLHLPRVDWFELDGETGTKSIIIAVSRSPLQRQQLEKEVLAASAPAVSDEKTREPPPIANEKNRGPRVRARIDQRGIAVLRFPFQQEQ
jgi:hypothetical protein